MLYAPQGQPPALDKPPAPATLGVSGKLPGALQDSEGDVMRQMTVSALRETLAGKGHSAEVIERVLKDKKKLKAAGIELVADPVNSEEIDLSSIVGKPKERFELIVCNGYEGRRGLKVVDHKSTKEPMYQPGMFRKELIRLLAILDSPAKQEMVRNFCRTDKATREYISGQTKQD